LKFTVVSAQMLAALPLWVPPVPPPAQELQKNSTHSYQIINSVQPIKLGKAQAATSSFSLPSFLWHDTWQDAFFSRYVYWRKCQVQIQ
jgi:hypothetical protein